MTGQSIGEAASELPDLPERRRAVLYALRRRGQTSVEELAKQLAMTQSGARQHLNALVESGLVEADEREPSEPRRGRRTIAYSVTPAADELFPKTYPELTNELLGYVQERDPVLLAEIFDRRGNHRVDTASARLSSIDSLGGKVDELARILDEDGYFASSEALSTGVFRIVENNCAIWAIAQRYGHACSSEIEFIRAVLPEAEVTRVEHMIAGARRCAYEIRARPPTHASRSR
ncbi:MAG TPA: ArsR family transcriptional regulator [Acidimicrobiales bacterium]|jgi:DeoR family suf operon transcriptional repressor|nr:ArsR family transcriptional regulator [Acidimicrobiales bacterium]